MKLSREKTVYTCVDKTGKIVRYSCDPRDLDRRLYDDSDGFASRVAFNVAGDAVMYASSMIRKLHRDELAAMNDCGRRERWSWIDYNVALLNWICQ